LNRKLSNAYGWLKILTTAKDVFLLILSYPIKFAVLEIFPKKKKKLQMAFHSNHDHTTP